MMHVLGAEKGERDTLFVGTHCVGTMLMLRKQGKALGGSHPVLLTCSQIFVAKDSVPVAKCSKITTATTSALDALALDAECKGPKVMKDKAM